MYTVKQLSTLHLFTDGSADPQSKIGYGAYLVGYEKELIHPNLKEKIKTKRFENTSSTKLELQTLIWALEEIQPHNPVIIYTDCQNILGLPARRARFEKNNYHTKNNKLIANHELYKTFYTLFDRLDLTFHKLSGHKRSSEKNDIDRLFTLVDRASRSALREGSIN